jgi:ketosteroid isomerase-like protein
LSTFPIEIDSSFGRGGRGLTVRAAPVIAPPPCRRDTARAMTQEIINRLRAGLDAFNRTGELDTEFLASEFEMHQASSIIDTAGVFYGRDALHGSLNELAESFEDLSFEAEKFFEAPSGEVLVFIRARGRGRGSGLEMDNRIAWVWTFRGDKAVRLVVYEEQADALEAVGLSD